MSSKERIDEFIQDYRKSEKKKFWSGVTSGLLGLALIGVCLYIFFFAWPTIK